MTFNRFISTLAMLIFATVNLFSQAKWVPSAWPADSTPADTETIKHKAAQLLAYAAKTTSRLDTTHVAGVSRYHSWATSVKINTSPDFVYEFGAAADETDPFWFSVKTNKTNVQWTPKNNFCRVWTNWPNDLPKVDFVLNDSSQWQILQITGFFSAADEQHLNEAIAEVQLINSHLTAREAIARADAIDDDQDQKILVTTLYWGMRDIASFREGKPDDGCVKFKRNHMSVEIMYSDGKKTHNVSWWCLEGSIVIFNNNALISDRKNDQTPFPVEVYIGDELIGSYYTNVAYKDAGVTKLKFFKKR